ncbi:MAG TPA: prepilin-type N-terminal cleavage/methylation domain-containing protein [Pirellulales bacterium]|nr:prepilin-type N-terminal cleavage/methylation domain-containing protein [Pirellulales bacterium]
MPTHHRRARHGFTLVELLVTIGIIGMLMSLLVVGVRQAMLRARVASTVVEISKLASSVQAFKERYGAYPLCMGDKTASATGSISGRQQRFVTSVRKAFPRYVPANPAYSTINTFIQSNYKYKNKTQQLMSLSLDTLDPSESLVFWLGGFPTPVDTASGLPRSSRKLFGFHTDPTAPFRVDTSSSSVVAQRTTSLFDFDDGRLQDSDNDGWLEYVPSLLNSVDSSAPYVYFDAQTYTQGSPSIGQATSANYLGYSSTVYPDWGVAVPWAGTVSSTAPISWINPNTFQIISSGADGSYSSSNELSQSSPRVPVYPAAQEYRYGSATTATALDSYEQDNLTNFADGTVSDAAGS